MAKQLNVKLNFQADTSQVQQALASLTTSLNNISNITPTVGNKLTQDLSIAKKSAQDLQMHLNNAFNVKTGNLDLGKLDASLKSSGQSLGQLSSNLLKAGTQGEQAFLNIQRAIGNASIQINQANGALTSFLTTLKNTARWQISSSILHGFMGALQSAWGYAKDLDKSLNNIRIVTGYSSDKMADFAEQANKAAKALSTTTTKYTDASLIFYQQGLSDDEVQKRTEVTIKMANAAGQSAEVVSDQLTAVWNNFYDGTKSLEYYADVMTALGAATASSTDEIAGGLEKFAAIGETIGLSYEYAAAALATITSNTRQSEDVVGTALKTIFARIQGLKLGETLDDGVTLNKYSEALQSVGISIFEQNGELKKMDDILDEMGEKWNILSKAQQTALAQTVAGTRQYTQLIALMKDWDSGDNDSMMANLETAYNSEGALQEQADIYADSWEAAVDRVKASAEGIYRDLFPTEELTGLMDGFAILLDGIDGLVQSFGGLQGILLLISSIALNSFRNQIGGAIDELIFKVGGDLTNAFSGLSSTFQSGGILAGLKQMVGYNGNIINQTQTLSTEMRQASDSTQTMSEKMALTEANMERGVSQALKMSMEMTKSAQEAQTMDASFGEYNSNLMSINNIQAVIERSTKYLTKEQQEQLVILQEQAQAANEQLLTAKQLADEAERKKNALLEAPGDQGTDLDRYVTGTPETPEDSSKIAYTSDLMNTKSIQDMVQGGLDLYNTTREVGNAWAENSIVLDTYKNHLALAFDSTVDLNAVNKEAKATFAGLVDAGADVEEVIKNCTKGSDDMGIALDGALKKMSSTKMGAKIANDIRQAAEAAGGLAKNSTLVREKIATATKEMHTFGVATGSSEKNMLNIKDSVLGTRTAVQNVSSAAENLNNKFAQVTNTLQNALNSSMSFGRVFTDLASSFSSVAMGINAISNAIDTINDEDASFTSKLTAGAMAATMGIRGLTSAMGVLSTFIKSVTTYTNLKTVADQAQILASKTATAEEKKAAAATMDKILIDKMGLSQEQRRVVVKNAVRAAQKGQTGATLKDTIANYANVASQAAKYWYITLIIAVVAALAAGIYFLVTAEDAETKALKAATEALERSTEAHKEAQQAVEDFKAALSNYEDGIKGLQDIAEESNNLKEAIEDVNKKAKELIETYGLFRNFHYGEFGEIIIDEEALKNAEKQLLTYEKIAASIRYTNELRYQQAQTDKKFKDTAEDIKYTVAYEYTEDRYGQRNKDISYLKNPDNYKIRDYNRFIMNEDRTAAQKGIAIEEISLLSKDLKILNQAFDSTKESLNGIPPNAEQLIEAIENNKTAYGNLSDVVEYNLENVITDNITKFTDLSSGLEKVTEASLYFAKEILGIYTDDEYAEGISKAANGDSVLEELMTNAKNTILAKSENSEGISLDEKIKQRENQLTQDVLNKVSNYDVAGGTEGNIEAFIESIFGLTEGTGEIWLKDNYSEIFGDGVTYSGNISSQEMGQQVLEAKGFQITSTKDESRSTVYSYLDKEGKPQSITYDNNEAQETWATLIGNYAIGEEASGEATIILEPETLENVMSTIVENGEQMGADWTKAFISGVASEDFDFSSLFGDLSQSEITSLNNMTGEEIAEMFGINLDDLSVLGFESADAFAAAFKEGLVEYSEEDAKNALDIEYGNKAEDLGIDKSEFEAYKDLLQVNKDIAEAYKDNYKGLNEIALANKRMEKGVKSLAKNWEDFDDIMSDSTSTAEDISSVLPEINEGLQDVLNLSDEEFELLPPDFAQKNWDLIQDVMNGVEGSVDKLRDKAGEETLLNLGAKVDADGDGSVDAAFMEIHNKIAEYDNMEDFTVGVAIDPAKHAEFIASCNELINAAGMTAEQAQAYFASMGYDVELEKVEAPPKETPWHIENPILDEEKTKEAGVPIFSGTEILTGTNTSGGGEALAVKTITPNGSFGGGVGVNTTAPSSATGGGSGGGGGGSESSPAKPMKKTKRSDIGERYEQIDNKLDNLADTMTKVQNISDTLWGKSHINNLKQQNALIEEEISLLEKKYQEAKDYAASDLEDLKSAAADLGVSLQIDTNTGDILNIEEVYDKIHSKLSQAENTYNSFATSEEQSEYQEATLDPLNDQIELFDEYYALYKESLEMAEDLEIELQEKMIQIQENNFAIWQEELEIHIELNEDDMKLIEHLLNRMEDNFYSMAEAANLMVNNQFNNYIDTMKAYENSLADLEEKYKNNEINMADYVEGLNTLNDGLLETADSMIELDRAMTEYYADTLSAANDELSKYTDAMEHQASTLEHYSNMLSLLGKENDYKKLAVVLEGQTKLAESSVKVAKKNLEMLENQKQSILEKYNDALADGNKEAAELYKKQYEDVLEASQEALEEYQSKVEEWTEAIKAELENSMKDIHKTLEEALTGGSSFDKIITQMERAQSLQEEYLTDTNKIYETEKMIRKAQQEIDKTSNTVAKRKLKDFINEQKALQDQVKVSQFELDIQQAKYNLLLARIALEEAQNAKSTVRLQRDSEGNFGYVYTADQNTIADAEQKVADSEQALYQLGIDGANEYTQKRIQITQEMYNALEELAKKYANGEISSQEEYEAERLKIIEYYGEKILDYENLYQIAISADARILSDAWSTGFQDSIAKGTEFETALTEYLGNIQGAFATTQEKLKPIIEDTFGLDYENLHGSVDNVVSSNTTLSNQIIDTLIPSLDQEMTKVGEATEKWANMKRELDSIVKDLEKIAKFATTEIKTISGFGDSDQSFKEEEEKSNNNNSNSNNNNNSNNSNNNNNNNLSIDWGINQIHKGLWGNGWDNRWQYAKAAGYTEEQFEQIKQYIIDYYNGLYTSSKTSRTTTSPKTQTTSTSKPTYLQNDWGQQNISFNVDSNKVDAASELLAKKLAEEEYLRQMDQKNADIRRRNAAGDAASYDTGGYTGEWGPYGKLAFLHEKELILNEKDTENWLTSIQEINKTLELYGKNLQLETRLRSYKMNDYSNGLEQKVYIEASFPSVVEHTEIELAFENLINEASQYAYRFNKN